MNALLGFQKSESTCKQNNIIVGFTRHLRSVVCYHVSLTKATTTKNGTVSEKNIVIDLNNSEHNVEVGCKCSVFLKRGLLKRMF